MSRRKYHGNLQISKGLSHNFSTASENQNQCLKPQVSKFCLDTKTSFPILWDASLWKIFQGCDEFTFVRGPQEEVGEPFVKDTTEQRSWTR